MRPDRISIDKFTADNKLFGRLQNRQLRNILGNQKQFLVFFFPPLFAGFENPFWLSPIQHICFLLTINTDAIAKIKRAKSLPYNQAYFAPFCASRVRSVKGAKPQACGILLAKSPKSLINATNRSHFIKSNLVFLVNLWLPQKHFQNQNHF